MRQAVPGLSMSRRQEHPENTSDLEEQNPCPEVRFSDKYGWQMTNGNLEFYGKLFLFPGENPTGCLFPALLCKLFELEPCVMDPVLRVIDRMFYAVQGFGPAEWGILALISVTIGYLCLKGMSIR